MKTGVPNSVLFVFLLSNIHYTCTGNSTSSILSRHKRYVVFPEGSSLTVAFCITMNLIEVPTIIFTELINFGINYDLPNKTSYHLLNFVDSKQQIQRRHRRDLYSKIEIVLNAIGYNGRSCVYRTLCEASQNLLSVGDNLLEELIRRIFRFPLDKLRNSEPEDHRLYHWAHRMGREKRDCSELFPDCSISIIDIVLGYKRVGNIN